MGAKPAGGPGRGRRVTLAVVCLVLGFLGFDDAYVVLRNRAPHELTVAAPVPAHWAWLELQGGQLDLAEAISTSGTADVVALLAPLRPSGGGPAQVLVETRAAGHLELFRQLHFGQDTEADRVAFLASHREALLPSGPVRGLRLRGYVARSNIAKLSTLALEGGLQLHPDAFILVEGQSPSPWRALFFLAMAVAGLVKVALLGRRGA